MVRDTGFEPVTLPCKGYKLRRISQGSFITATSAFSPGVTDQFTIRYNVDATGIAPGKNIVLVAIPEPSAGAILVAGVGLFGLFGLRRSRRRQARTARGNGTGRAS